MIEKVILGFGSNTGNRFMNISFSLRLIYLSRNFDILKLSRIYETEPWGFKNQNNFLNCAAVCLYRGGPFQLLDELKMIEKMTGRVKRAKWREREADIDILFYGNQTVKEKGLEIPHPYLQYRNFVLTPLNEIIPEFVHPVLGETVRYLYKHSRDKCEVSLFKKQVI
jgi:dihydroneopterin aldolase / 2-amino-4-hydroxy-6-hydroxymethyldihydropteridine diphosphokinase